MGETTMRRSPTTLKKLFSRFLLVIISVLATFVATELGFRAMLFLDTPYMQRYRDPGLYAYFESDDYWKLYFIFGGKYKPPKTPHPLLG